MADTSLNWIDGSWVGSAGGAISTSINPSTGETLGSFADAGREDGLAAIEAARNAFENTSWAHQPRLRASVLLKFADLMEAEAPRLARSLAQENGKLIGEATHEVAAGVSELRYYAGLARNIFGRISEVDENQFSM